MKIRMLVLMLVALFCVEMVSAQYMLPIGKRVNERPAEVWLAIGGYGVWADDIFAYNPSMGDLESLIRNRLWKLAEGFVPAAGYDEAKVEVLVTPGPFGGSVFKLQRSGDRWVVPTEALNVELIYGPASIPVPGITGVEVEVRGGGRTEKFSTIARTGGTACEIDTTLFGTFAVIHRRFAVPKYRESWWTEGEVTLWEGERWARFTMEGEFINSSPVPPAFLAELKVAPQPPRITSIKMVERVAEISVSVADGTLVVLEFSEDFKKWVTVDPPTVSKMSKDSRVLAHTATNACGFYRIVVPKIPGSHK